MSKELSPQEQAYLQGFAAKCAEYGVDPEVLVKVAGPFPRVEKFLTAVSAGRNELADIVQHLRSLGLRTSNLT